MSARSTSWFSSLLGGSGSSTNTAALSQRVQEPFYDSRDKQDWTFGQHINPLVASLEATLLPHMPSLFSTSLPPCGLEIQIAYQNMIHRLRLSWLRHIAQTQSTVGVPLVSLCTDIKRHLEREQNRHPIGSLHKSGDRIPWRRENVFRFELRWADYFVREAEMLQRWPNLNGAEREKQQLTSRLYPIPKELRIVVWKKENMKEVMKMWNMWNEEKRRDLAKDDDWHEIDDEEQEECIERTREVEGAAQNSLSGPDWVEENHAESDHSQRATSLLNRNPADGDGEE